ncbi:MAG: uracil-DNA glycosylase [Alphaproteobacteria bacterium]|jgi:uracil-DNA glycosylase|nr:uracil-DNA glycosylase [Alphaproteobacteria bacterium]
MKQTPAEPEEPGRDCDICPRLVEFRHQNRELYPDWHNAPVASFGTSSAQLLIIGLAPGLRGANRTARPFTGDYAGDLLYPTLLKFGFAQGTFDARPDDGLELVNCRITNAVRCVPPQNKPTGSEVRACLDFLTQEVAAMPRLRIMLCLGTLAHNATLRLLGEKQSAYKFGHAAKHALPDGRLLIDSYHCSRYNTNTGRLTEPMFHAVFKKVRELL